MVKLFLYGTLKKGERNFHKLPKGKRKKAFLKDFIVLPSRSPRLVPKKGSIVEGELFEHPLTRLQLWRLDLFEWKYKRICVAVEGENCWVYVWRKGFKAKECQK